MSEHTVQSTFSLSRELHEALQVKAASTDQSVSDLVNSAIKLLLQEDERDLQAFEERADEPTISYEELLNDLNAHGKL